MTTGSTNVRAELRLRSAMVRIWPAFLLPTVPLFCHRSDDPVLASYGQGYVIFLTVVLALGLAGAVLMARRAVRRRSYRSIAGVWLALVSLGLALVALELGLSAWIGDAFGTYRRWGQQKSAILVFETRPKHRWAAHGGRYSSDEDGFRTHVSDPAWRSRRQPDRPLVFVIGGSSAFGYGLNDDHSWPHLAEAALRARAATRDVTVINAGNNGHNSVQLLTRLYLRVLPYRPSHVLYYGGINDVYESGSQVDALADQGEIAFAPSQRSYWAAQNADKNPYVRSLLWYVLQKRVPGLAAVPRRDVPLGELASRQIDANRALFERNLRTMADLCRRQGAVLVLTTFLYEQDAMPPYHRESLARYNDTLRGVAQAEGLPLIDLARDFAAVEDRQGFFFEDHYHPAWSGAKWIAARLADGFADLLQ